VLFFKQSDCYISFIYRLFPVQYKSVFPPTEGRCCSNISNVLLLFQAEGIKHRMHSGKWQLSVIIALFFGNKKPYAFSPLEIKKFATSQLECKGQCAQATKDCSAAFCQQSHRASQLSERFCTVSSSCGTCARVCVCVCVCAHRRVHASLFPSGSFTRLLLMDVSSMMPACRKAGLEMWSAMEPAAPLPPEVRDSSNFPCCYGKCVCNSSFDRFFSSWYLAIGRTFCWNRMLPLRLRPDGLWQCCCGLCFCANAGACTPLRGNRAGSCPGLNRADLNDCVRHRTKHSLTFACDHKLWSIPLPLECWSCRRSASKPRRDLDVLNAKVKACHWY